MAAKVLDVKDVAAYLGVGTKAIYNLVSEGKLKAARVGRSIKIAEESVEEYMNLAANNRKTERESQLEKEVQYLKQKLADRDRFIETIKINLIKLSEVS